MKTIRPLIYSNVTIGSCYDRTLNRRVLDIKFDKGNFDIWSFAESDDPKVIHCADYGQAVKQATTIITCYRLLHPENEVWGGSERRDQ